MKIFISMPMRAKSTEQVRVEMDKVFQYIKNKMPLVTNIELIGSIIDGADSKIALQGDNMACWYLAKSIELMAEADLVFFVNNWESARGCVVERQVAEAYNKFCIDIEVNV